LPIRPRNNTSATMAQTMAIAQVVAWTISQ
jgi:hypothetical protein